MFFFNLLVPNRDLFPRIKQVRFNNEVKIRYYAQIITTESMKSELWWQRTDLYLAKYYAANDISRLISIHPKMTIKEATKLLYQPNNVTYDTENFII